MKTEFNANMAPIEVKSAVDILIDRLTQAILDGTFKAGEKIPTEPELASIFGVGRNTVREAVRTMVAYGVLEVKRPNGTFVCKEFTPKGINPMIYGMILHGDDAYEELIGLRKVFENGILLLLSEKEITQEQEKKLQEILKRFETAVAEKSSEACIRTDIEFHDELCAMTGNRLIKEINSMITKMTYASRLKTINEILEKGDEQYLIDTHYNLLKALNSKDIRQLYDAIQDSYFYWKDVYKQKQASAEGSTDAV